MVPRLLFLVPQQITVTHGQQFVDGKNSLRARLLLPSNCRLMPLHAIIRRH